MNLLERTRRLLQGLAAPASAKVQYYSVACPEGHRLRGERTEGYQALRCPTCGEGIFVLPRSPLPEPVAAASPKTARTAHDTGPAGHARPPQREDEPIALSDPVRAESVGAADVDGEIEWLEPGSAPPAAAPAARADVRDAAVEFADDPALPEDAPPSPAGPQPGARRPANPARAAAAAAARGSPARGAQGRPAAVAVAVPRRERLVAWAVARRNPLIFLAVALLVVGTVGLRLWRSNFRDLPRIAERGRTEGLAALDGEDFDTAHKLLSEARRAVDSLGGAVEGAAEIRHGAEEAALFTSRIVEPLESILAEASPDPADKAWSSRFNTLYKGRAVLIIDAEVTDVPGSSESGAYELDYRVLPPGEGSDPRRVRVGRIDLTGFRLLELVRPKPGDQVRFGARLASLRLDTEHPEKPWLFGLEPDSGVILTHPEALQSIRGSVEEPDPGPGDAAP